MKTDTNADGTKSTTQTVQNTDGSKSITVTDSFGQKIERTEQVDGSSSETSFKPGGIKDEERQARPDGSATVLTYEDDGVAIKYTAEFSVPDSASGDVSITVTDKDGGVG
jgi:hypothetical protein